MVCVIFWRMNITLRVWSFIKIHMKQIENETEESRSQTITQSPNTRDDALGNSCKERQNNNEAFIVKIIYIFVKLEEYMSKEEKWALTFLEGTQLPCWSALAWEDANALMAGYVTLDMAAIQPAIHITLCQTSSKSLTTLFMQCISITEAQNHDYFKQCLKNVLISGLYTSNRFYLFYCLEQYHVCDPNPKQASWTISNTRPNMMAPLCPTYFINKAKIRV